MRWFNNMKVSVKLLAGFIIVALIAGGIGIIGVVNINTVNDLDTELYEKMTAPLGELVGIANSYQNIRSSVRDIILAGDATQISTYENSIKDNSSSFDSILNTFAESLLTDEGKALVEDLQTEKADYMVNVTEIVNFVKSSKIPEATGVLHGTAKTAADKVDAALQAITDSKLSLAKQASDNNDKTAQSSTFLTIVLLIAGMVIAIALGIFISFTISKPVKNLMEVAEKVAGGDLNVVVDIDAKDEIGALAAAFRKMTDNLNEVMSNISIASEQVSSGSRQVSDSSMALSQGATEQASSVEELTASLEEISSQTKQNANSANQANELAEAAKSNAVQGNAQMKEMLKSMDEINDSSSNISKIIKVIDEIAFQTNILALNAAVEAARAGQHGKGFAVVAEEVRNLAARSANAAKETTAMIEGSIKKVEGGTKIANETAIALNKIVDGISKVATLVSDIAVASNEQASGIAQINQGIMQVSQVVQTNSATSEESAAASEELASQAELMKEQVSRFKLRKNHYSPSSYRGMEGIDPDVLRMLEGMSKKKKPTPLDGIYSEGADNSSKKIALSDNEFGKY